MLFECSACIMGSLSLVSACCSFHGVLGLVGVHISLYRFLWSCLSTLLVSKGLGNCLSALLVSCSFWGLFECTALFIGSFGLV